MPDKSKKNYMLSSVKNALRILNSFSIETPEKRVSELAFELGIGKSTVSRLLSTLASEGYVMKEGDNQKYRLGLQILALNSIVTSQLEINHAALPVLKELVRDTGEAALISILEDKVVYIEQMEGSHPDPVLTYVGGRNPVHCTSEGKLLLAFHEAANIKRILANGLTAYTPKTVTDPRILRKQLADIRENGFCYCESEYMEDIVSYAAPIKDYSKGVVAALTLVVPVQRLQHQPLINVQKKVMKAATEISKNLGYFGP